MQIKEKDLIKMVSQQHYGFKDSSHALTWMTETMRRKMFPRVSQFYKDIASQVAEESDTWRMHTLQLPTDYEEAMMLASRVTKLMKELDKEQQSLLMLKYWGDFYSRDHFEKTVRQIELLRQRGQRVRLNYRYSLRQIGAKTGINYKTVQRRIHKAESELDYILGQHGLIEGDMMMGCHKDHPLQHIV